MGILSSLQNFVTKNVSATTREKVVSAADTALTVLTSPIAAIKNFQKAKQETSVKTPLKLVAEGVENTLLVVAPFSSGVKSVAAKVAINAVSTVKGAVATFLGAAGLVGVASTKTGREVLTSLPTPSDIFTGTKTAFQNTTAFLGGEDSNLPTEKEWYAVARGLGLGAGIAILAAGGVYLGYKLFGDKLKKVENDTPDFNTAPDIPTPSLPTEKPTNDEVIPTNTTPPTLPETVRVSPTQIRRKKRSTKAKQPLNIIQRTNIMINNTNSGTKLKTKKYLNARVI
jgi:hypothetical protein